MLVLTEQGMDQDGEGRELEKNQVTDDEQTDSGVVRYCHACTLTHLVKELPSSQRVSRRDDVLHVSRPLSPDRRILVFSIRRCGVCCGSYWGGQG
jgi:hypothetical protein